MGGPDASHHTPIRRSVQMSARVLSTKGAAQEPAAHFTHSTAPGLLESQQTRLCKEEEGRRVEKQDDNYLE